MNQFLLVTQNKKFLLSTSISLVLIWFLGPYLAIAGTIPLESTLHRVIASLFIYLSFFAIEYKRTSRNLPISILPENVKYELETLHQTLRDVLKRLHRNTLKSLLFRYKRPWYLVLGPTNAGKSTLLTKSELGITGLDNLPPMTITSTKSFNWWLSDEAVFIDVGGRYLRDNKEPLNIKLLFEGFFKLLKKYRSFKPINGLILTINLQELTVNIREQSQLQKLREVIDELVSHFADFPIYLIITRCDTIEGFTEFFEDLGPEERNQIFGLSFPLSPNAHSLPQLFNDQFNTLLTRLNEKIIWKLHHENHPDKIAKIKNFPLQMEFLKNPLAKLLNVILPNINLNLRGIFFTSAFQKDIPYDNLNKSLARAFDMHHMNNAYRSTPSKNFFLNDIFKRIIFPEAKFYVSSRKDHHPHLLTSFIIILITSACLFLFFKSYQYNQRVLINAQQALQNLNNLPSQNETDLLFQKLNLLQTLLSELTQDKSTWYSHVGLQQSNKLKSQAEEIYSKLLVTQFLNYLQRTLEIQLQNVKDGDSNQLYAALKVYLMLGKHQFLDQRYFANWFDNYWHQLDDNNQLHQQLNKHLQFLLSRDFGEITLNTQIIEQKRVLLNSMPVSRLVLTILQNQYQRSPVKLMPEAGMSALNTLPNEVPGIFNILNFKDVYYKQLPNTCREITKGDWVLGKKAQNPLSEIMLYQLSSEVKAIYLNEYAQTWSEILAKVKMSEFQTLSQIVAMIDLLNIPESPLIQLLNTIKNNTQPLSDSVEFTQQVSARFLSLNTLSADLLKNTHQASLMAVKEYLTKIIQSPEMDKASYDAARARMENQTPNDAITQLLQQSRMLPDPLQTWQTTVAAESWRLILKNTQNYLNKIWVATIYPQYEALLDKRYPLFKDATTDISLNDFANFFGNGGTMDTFFKNYLQPFVDNSRLYWEWKNIDGQRINIPQTTLEMFIRAALIQKMFFPEEAKFPAITFSLVPVELDANVQSFGLDLEGQAVLFQKDNEQIISLSWPGPSPNHTEIAFTNDQGKKSALTESGPWSWFKILDRSRLESTNNPKHYRLTFSLNGSSVHYELYTNGVVNPFLPGILNTFRCPGNL